MPFLSEFEQELPPEQFLFVNIYVSVFAFYQLKINCLVLLDTHFLRCHDLIT